MLQKPPFLQKLFLWVTRKPVYIFRRCIASCTVIIMLTALSAPSHISDSYTHWKNKLWTDVEKIEHMKVTWWVSLQYLLGIENVFTCEGLPLSAAGDSTMKDFVRWTDDEWSFFLFIGIPFLVYGFGQCSNFPWVCSVRWRMESHKQQKQETSECKHMRGPGVSKTYSSYFPLLFSKIPSILSHLSHFSSSPSFLPTVAPRLSCLCVS